MGASTSSSRSVSYYHTLLLIVSSVSVAVVPTKVDRLTSYTRTFCWLLHTTKYTPSMSTSPRGSASPAPHAGPRHGLSAVEKQRAQLEKLLKNPEKPAYVPPPPKEKTIRPAREMMKNVQGSSAGAGSGEFHVYKASRRREYERLKMMEEEAQKVRRHGFLIIVRNPSVLLL